MITNSTWADNVKSISGLNLYRYMNKCVRMVSAKKWQIERKTQRDVNE